MQLKYNGKEPLHGRQLCSALPHKDLDRRLLFLCGSGFSRMVAAKGSGAFTDVDFKLLWSDSSNYIGTEVATFLEHHGGDDPDAKAAPTRKQHRFSNLLISP